MYNIVSGARGRERDLEDARGCKRSQEEPRGLRGTRGTRGTRGPRGVGRAEGAEGAGGGGRAEEGGRPRGFGDGGGLGVLGILRIGGHCMPCPYRRVLSVSRFDLT